MKVVAIVGMPGSGKSEAADVFAEKGFHFVRLGQLTLDEVSRRGLRPTEALEREIREGLRKKHGMAAFATLNFPKIDSLLEKGSVVVDGLYSWDEYKAFREKYGSNLTVLAIYASPRTRHDRLSKRRHDEESDKEMRRRMHTKEEARSRDMSQLENLHTGGPIAMADFTIVNEGGIEQLREEAEKILNRIEDR